MHAAGVRGVRFNFVKRLADFTPREVLVDIAQRIAPLGWHVVVYFEAHDLPELYDFFTALPTTVVVDHMGRPDVSKPGDGPEFELFVDLMREHGTSGARSVAPNVSSPDRARTGAYAYPTSCRSRDASWRRFPSACCGAPTGRIPT